MQLKCAIYRLFNVLIVAIIIDCRLKNGRELRINRTGFPTKNSTYDAALVKRCEKAGIKRVSMHDLRHTFATRFVEASNNYKYLSVMLGHSSIKITMDLYVHQTDESQVKEADKFIEYTKSVGIV